MNTKTIGAIALAGALAIVGCVSVENTRAQLSSGNPQEVQKAEDNILRIATTGKDESGFMHFDTNQQIEYVNLASNNALLLKIIDNTREDEIILAAANKIDLTKPGIGMEILTKHKGMLEKVARAEPNGGEDSAFRDKKAIAKGGKKGGAASLGTSTCFADKVFASLKDEELRTVLSSNDVDYYSIQRDIANRLIATTQDVQLLASFYDGDFRSCIPDYAREAVVMKLSGLSDKLTDAKMVVKVLNASRDGWHPYITDYDTRAKLLARLPDSEAVEFALQSVRKQSINSWGYDQLYFIYDGVAVANSVKDSKAAVDIVSSVLSKIEEIKQSCDTSMLTWDAKEEQKANEIIKSLPKFDDRTVEALVCADDSNWSYFIDAVSPAVAYSILAGGKAKSCDLELELIKKLSKEKLDAAVYKGAHFIKTRKTIYNLMSAELKKTVDAEKEKAYKAIVEKAKSAEKETFALDGFYLGMPFDEMIVVFDHLFPKVDVRESFDGEEKDSDYVIYVDGQSSPFCYAQRKDKKVYQFNFGKKLLKKWYQYDVQTPMEWAYAYSRDNKIDMKFKLIEKDTTVYEMDMSRSYRVWFHQESYQYKHNSKEYRLTYFGEEKDFTFEGGLGGAVIKGLAAPRFRYVRGDPGSLRARIERD